MIMTTAIRHIPHDSTVIPEAFRDQYVLSEAQLNEVLLRMTDHHTAALFSDGSSMDLVFPVSRLLVDVERFEDDEQEVMAAIGMGVLYTKTHEGKDLRRELAPEEREKLLATYYRPHHALLEERVVASLDADGRALIIDCHSFPEKRLSYEIGEEGLRPEICLGTDAFHTPVQLLEAAIEGFEEAGFSVNVDQPFAGALTPIKHYGVDQRVQAIMIEIRRDLYMNEETGRKNDRFDEIRGKVHSVIKGLENVATRVGCDDG